MADDNSLPLSQKDMDDLNTVKSKLPPDHPMRGKIDQALSLNAGETQNKPGGPIAKSTGPMQGPQPDEAQSQVHAAIPDPEGVNAMGSIAAEHPGAAALGTAAGLTGGLAAAVPEATIAGIGAIAKNPTVQGAAGGLAYHYAPPWLKSMIIGAGLMRGSKRGGEEPTTSGEPVPTVGEPPARTFPEPSSTGPSTTFESVPGPDLERLAQKGQEGAAQELMRRGQRGLYIPKPTIGSR